MRSARLWTGIITVMSGDTHYLRVAGS
jgi:hypothetical protein